MSNVIYNILGEQKSKRKCPDCGVSYVKRSGEWYCPNCNREM
jgi:uncharacterized Zn finger protein (UPF0148 family)